MQPRHAQRRSDATPLAALAFGQHGIVTWAELLALGFTPGQIRRLVAAGHLIRLSHGVYAVGHTRLTLKGRWLAAVRGCGDGGCLSHRDALALHHVSRPGCGLIHVSAPGRHRLAGVRCHVIRNAASLGRTVIDAIPVTSLERAVLDVAPSLPAQRLRALLEEVERHNRFDRRRFDALLGCCNGHRGIGRLRAALATLGDVAPRLDSDLEVAFLTLIREAGLPEPVAQAIVAGERVDLWWPRLGLIVEVDSWLYHRSRRSFEDDRRRANVFALAGLTLLRITDLRIEQEPAAVIAELAAVLERLAARCGN